MKKGATVKANPGGRRAPLHFIYSGMSYLPGMPSTGDDAVA